MTPLKTALCRSFSEPKQVHNLEIIFKIKFPENRFARMPDYSRTALPLLRCRGSVVNGGKPAVLDELGVAPALYGGCCKLDGVAP